MLTWKSKGSKLEASMDSYLPSSQLEIVFTALEASRTLQKSNSLHFSHTVYP